MKKIQSCALLDGMANLETFLFARNILRHEQWKGHKEISSDGTDRAYDPVGDERAYFEDSTIIPNLESKQRSIREVSRNTTMDE